MGLFYNYNKEGPGVRKKGPNKRVFIRFFEAYFRNAWKMIPVCFLYCLFLIVPGFSAVGITGVSRSISRDKHSFGVSDFFSTIKKNWKQALAVGIINIIVTVILILDFSFFTRVSNTVLKLVGTGISLFLLFLFTVMKYYVWFLIITFDMSVSKIYSNSFKFFVINMKNNMIMFVSTSIFWVIFYLLLEMRLVTPLIAGILMVIMICFYPLFHYLIIQFGIFGSIKKYIIDPYYAENPDADIEKRRALGLDTGEETEPDFEDIL